ncbi:MAG: hypothetical protein E7261_03005 [Lachnospiraceae bacterium]|nr:hypothetical protein [Lachnospiraceae bacterium]
MKNENTKSVRERKAAARKKAELKKNLKYVAIVAIPVILIALVILAAVIGKKSSTIEINYGAGLDENGKIANVNVSDYVQLCDFSNIVFQEPEVTMTDEEWEAHVTEILKAAELDALTDEYIAENYGEHAKTVAEYEAYIKNLAKEENIKTGVLDYLLENSTVASIPAKYLDVVEENYDMQYKAEYNYYNNMYYQFLGDYNWKSHLDYYEMSRSEYKAMVKKSATDSAKQNLVLQAAFEKLGFQLTDEDVKTAIIESGYTEADMDTAIENYGMPYWKQFAITYKVVTEIAKTVRVN